jgi:hypothetical protein
MHISLLATKLQKRKKTRQKGEKKEGIKRR